jgi:hypothetical protein
MSTDTTDTTDTTKVTDLLAHATALAVRGGSRSARAGAGRAAGARPR